MNLGKIKKINSQQHNANTLGIIEFGSLLNQLPGAALLYDRRNDSILLANNPIIQMTAFAQDEIIGRPIQFFFPTLKSDELTPGYEKTVVLNRRMRDSISVQLRINILDIPGHWLLISVNSFQTQSLESELTTEELSDILDKLDAIFEDSDSERAIENTLSLVKEKLGCEFISLYRAKNETPELEKIAFKEDECIFPNLISSADLIRLSGTTTWMPGKKVITEIHRTARMKDVSGVLSCPLGKEGARNGLLIAATRKSFFSSGQVRIFEIISAQLSKFIEKEIHISNLKQEMNRQKTLAVIWKGIFDNAKQGIIVLSADHQIISVNSSLELMLGYAEKEVKNETIENILVGSDKLPSALDLASRGISTPDIGSTYLHRRDGSSFPAQIQLIPMVSEQKLDAIIVFIADISEHEQIRIQSQQLEHRALLGEVMGVFAHEVRNPINNISTGLQLLPGRLNESDPNLDLITRMQGDCTRLNDLMESVLTFSRPLEPHLCPLELDALLQRIIHRWSPRFTKLNVKHYFQVAENIPRVAGDMRTLEQVFTNLISNAVEAMSNSGGNLSIRIVKNNDVPNVPQVEVTVTDNGPGIPDEIKDRIFEPFVTSKAKGTGLGLSIVKQIVTAHHGSVKLSTFPGGTTFHVYLPTYNGD